MKIARWIFTIAGIYGIISLVPDYFLEARIAREYPPAITHPEFYYGFVGLALMWQFAFLAIATDPERFRPFMWLGIGEKASFVIAAAVLWAQGRLAQVMLPFVAIDLGLGIAFLWAWVASGKDFQPAASRQGPAASQVMAAGRQAR